MKIIKVSSSQGCLNKNIGCKNAPVKIVELLNEVFLNEEGKKEDFIIEDVKIVENNIEETNKNIQNAQATIGFKVAKAWLSENNLQSEDISLYRFNNNQWIELGAKVTSSDGSYVYYEAATPGFSYFAVAGESSSATPETSVETPTTETETPVIVCGDAVCGENEAETCPSDCPAPVGATEPLPEENEGKPWTWILVAALVFVLVIGYYLWQKKKNGPSSGHSSSSYHYHSSSAHEKPKTMSIKDLMNKK